MTTVSEAHVEAQIQEAKLVAPRVTPNQIDVLMARVTYKTHRVEGTTTTFVYAILDADGEIPFTLATGHSTCVSKANFNEQIGFDIAKREAEALARNKLWELEGYALKIVLDGLNKGVK